MKYLITTTDGMEFISEDMEVFEDYPHAPAILDDILFFGNISIKKDYFKYAIPLKEENEKEVIGLRIKNAEGVCTIETKDTGEILIHEVAGKLTEIGRRIKNGI